MAKQKQKKDLGEAKGVDEEIETALPFDLKEIFSEYKGIGGEMPKLQILKNMKRVDKSKDVVDKSKDVMLEADSLMEISADKGNKEIVAAILTTALAFNQNCGVENITNAFKNVKDALGKQK